MIAKQAPELREVPLGSGQLASPFPPAPGAPGSCGAGPEGAAPAPELGHLTGPAGSSGHNPGPQTRSRALPSLFLVLGGPGGCRKAPAGGGSPGTLGLPRRRLKGAEESGDQSRGCWGSPWGCGDPSFAPCCTRDPSSVEAAREGVVPHPLRPTPALGEPQGSGRFRGPQGVHSWGATGAPRKGFATSRRPKWSLLVAIRKELPGVSPGPVLGNFMLPAKGSSQL